MKNHFVGILTVLIVLAPAVFQLPAQSIKLEADIPFHFVVGSATLPAGRYRVEPIRPDIMLVRSADFRSSAFVQTIGVSAKDSQAEGKLVFKRYGQTYFLSQVWSPGYSTGRELTKSRLERRLAQGEPPGKSEVAVVGSR
jgi:hypothetical protein